MGGRGSGRRWRSGAGYTTEDYRTFDVRRLQRDGLLKAGHAFSWQWLRNGEEVASIRVETEEGRIILSYRHRSRGGEWESMEYPVALDWTPCAYGGRRAWFICPARGCGKRVAILYCGGVFACRRCYRLAYPRQRESAPDRAARRAGKIRKRLGWKPGILNGVGGKPKGMHGRTFQRLMCEHDVLADVALADIQRWLGIAKPQ